MCTRARARISALRAEGKLFPIIAAGVCCCLAAILLIARARRSYPAGGTSQVEKSIPESTGLNEALAKSFKEAMTAPPEYQAEALKIMLPEVSQFVDDLGLPEKNRPSPSNLLEVFVTPPKFRDEGIGFCMISVGDYTFSAARSNKLSFISPSQGTYKRSLDDMKVRFTLPNNLVNTNRALELALKWLKAAHVDTVALERECNVEVRHWDLGDYFVPLYWVKWTRGDKFIASVELFEPESRLVSMRINDARFNLRASLWPGESDRRQSRTR